MRFFYYYPHATKPIGGLKQIRLAASVLRELGVDVYLLRDSEYFETEFDDNVFYGIDVPSWPSAFADAGPRLEQEDVLLLPEAGLSRSLTVAANWRCRKGVNNQNGFHAMHNAPYIDLIRRTVEFAIANAPYVADNCTYFLGIPRERVFIVPHWLCRAPFGSHPAGPRRNAIAYMPRKLADLQVVIRELVGRSLGGVQWVPIDGLTEHQVADTLRRVTLFFAAQHDEGCPLPALEAMACGAAVVGFGGTHPFPHPYVSPENGWWAEDYCPVGAAKSVVEAWGHCTSGSDRYRATLSAGGRTVQKFSKEQVVRGLEAVVRYVSSGHSRGPSASVDNAIDDEVYVLYKRLNENQQSLDACRRILSEYERCMSFRLGMALTYPLRALARAIGLGAK